MKPRVLVVVVAGAFGLLLAQLAQVTLLAADNLAAHPANTRTAAATFDTSRGQIVTADGVVVAASGTEDNTAADAEQVRSYPFDDLYSDTVGYVTSAAGATGLEQSFGAHLSGTSTAVRYGGLTDLLTSSDAIGDLRLTLDHELQQRAADVLERTVVKLPDGTATIAAAVLLSTDGDLLALVSTPRAHVGWLPDPFAGAEVVQRLAREPNQPLASAAYQRTYRWHVGTDRPADEPSTNDTTAEPATSQGTLLDAWFKPKAQVELQLPAAARVGDGSASPVTIAAALAALATGQQALNPRLVHSVTVNGDNPRLTYTPSAASQLGLPTPGVAATAALAAATRSDAARDVVYLDGTVSEARWHDGGWADGTWSLPEPNPSSTEPTANGDAASSPSAPERATSTGVFTVAIAPAGDPQVVAVVVIEYPAELQPVAGTNTGFGTVTALVAAGLVDAATDR